jgi:general secretion pathway protein A
VLLENQVNLDLSKSSSNPFDPRTNAKYPYLSGSFREALAALYYGLEYGSRILVLCADPGTGKTTLLRHFERRMQDRGRALYFTLSDCQPSEVLHKLLSAIGGAVNDDLLDTRKQADQRLTSLSAADDPFMVLLDHDEDAAGVLDILRQLATLKAFQGRLLRVIVATSPEFAEELGRSEFVADIRRIILSPLAATEVQNYIEHRLRMVGWRDSSLFSAEAVESIAERSSGKPSSINEICLSLLQRPSERRDGLVANGEENPPSRAHEPVIGLQVPSSQSANGAVPAPALPDSAREALVESATAEAVVRNLVPVASSRNRRMAALACLVVILVIMVAGLWYRSALRRHFAKHNTADITSPRIRPVDRIHFRHRASGRSIKPSSTITANGVASKQILYKQAGEAASLLPDGLDTAAQSHVESPVASPAVSVTPSPVPEAAATVAAVVVMPTKGEKPAVASSPESAARAGSAGPLSPTIAKYYEKAVSTPRSQMTVTASLAVPPKTIVTDASTISVPAIAAKDNAHRAAGRIVADAIRLGDGYINIGDYDRAARSFLKAITIAPDDRRAQRGLQKVAAYEIRLGDAYMNIGDYDKALVSFSRASSLAPDNKLAQERLRRAHRAEMAEQTVLQ